MENTQGFLRRLSRFNDEVRQLLEYSFSKVATQERLTACEDAEQDLREAMSRREEAERDLRAFQALTEQAHNRWRQAELDERIARADAEMSVWALMAQSHETKQLQSLWQEPITSRAKTSLTYRALLSNRFFSVNRVQDNSYRFFTITHA